MMSDKKLKWIQSYLEKIYQQAPILEHFLQLHIVEFTEGKVTLSTTALDQHCNIYGFVHGGTLASIADVAMGISCVSFGKRVVTIDMSISYIKNAPAGSTLTALGEVISNGKTIMRAVGEIYHEQQLLIRSQASYFVIGEFTENDIPG